MPRPGRRGGRPPRRPPFALGNQGLEAQRVNQLVVQMESSVAVVEDKTGTVYRIASRNAESVNAGGFADVDPYVGERGSLFDKSFHQASEDEEHRDAKHRVVNVYARHLGELILKEKVVPEGVFLAAEG